MWCQEMDGAGGRVMRKLVISGFTLFELVIVIQILMILAVLAIPNLMRARMSAQEASAAGSMRLIAVSQTSFKAAGFVDFDNDGEGDYGTLAQLHDPDGTGVTPPYIDATLASGTKSGYRFTVTVFPGAPNSAPGYTCIGFPESPMRSGVKVYYVDETNVIRMTADGTVAGPNSPLLQ